MNIDLNKIQKETKVAKFLQSFSYCNGISNAIKNKYNTESKYNTMYLGVLNEYIEDIFVLNKEIIENKINNSIFVSTELDIEKIKTNLIKSGIEDKDIIVSNSVNDIPFDFTHTDFIAEIYFAMIKNKIKIEDRDNDNLLPSIIVHFNWFFRAIMTNRGKSTNIETKNDFNSFYEEYCKNTRVLFKDLKEEITKDIIVLNKFNFILEKYPEYKEIVFDIAFKIVKFLNRKNKIELSEGKHYLFNLDSSEDVAMVTLSTRLGGFTLNNEIRKKFNTSKNKKGLKSKSAERKVLLFSDLKEIDLEGIGVLACTEKSFAYINIFYNEKDYLENNYPKESLYSFFVNSAILVYKDRCHILKDFIKYEESYSNHVRTFLLEEPDHSKLSFFKRYKIIKDSKL